MNRDADRGAKSAPRGQKQLRAQQQGKREQRDAQSGGKDAQGGQRSDPLKKEEKAATVPEKPGGMVSPSAECQRSPGAHRKLSDASNTSEDLSKDSGCLSGKLSSSDSSSEISDCPSEGNKLDSPGGDNELSWIDDKADQSRGGGGGGSGEDAADGARRAEAAGHAGALLPADAAGETRGLFDLPGAYIELMMGSTTEDLVREVDDLRSENEYLKDEVEELRCEMLEMRDMFQEEEVYQLQELRLQLEQANKTCRILHYRLRKAERRSIRVAQTGQVDGELVKSLEHDIKVAKSVSRRLYGELEAVQKRSGQLEWDNEALRERTQELEVAKQVLQAELDKARENNQRKRSVRSSSSKAEKRLSQQLEDDSADLKCQLHFAKEELALMCKKLTKLVSESEAARDELARYQAAFGDPGAAHSPEGKPKSSRGREAEVRAHLKLVEEEATLLSRRIVELEVENRGLRAEMSDLREKVGGGGGGEEEEEDEENREVSEEGQTAKDREARGGGGGASQQAQEEQPGRGRGHVEGGATCHITREGPVGGEWDPSDGGEAEGDGKGHGGVAGMTAKDYQALLALRDHAHVVSSALQLLTAPPAGAPVAGEGLELLHAMLLAFICRAETLLTSGDARRAPPDAPAPGAEPEGAVDLRTSGVKQKAGRGRQEADAHADPLGRRDDPRMQLSLQILWILHQWCQVTGADAQRAEDKPAAALLRDLLRELGETLRDEPGDFDGAAATAPGGTSERAVSGVLQDGRAREAERLCSEAGEPGRRRRRRQVSPRGATRSRNWCYVSGEAAMLDREDPVRTWDHLIMPLSFPELDFQQMALERSHTAPEKSVVRIYYSPPSARRVQLAQRPPSPASDGESAGTPASWCTPLTSFSQLCLGSAANLSDDVKEAAAGWRPVERRGGGLAPAAAAAVACSGTQTHTAPLMVSVGQQTDGSAMAVAAAAVRSSPSRVLSPAPVSARSHHVSSSLDGISRAARTRASTSSPKLYRRHSASAASSLPTSSSSSSSSSSSRDRALWSASQQSHAGLAFTRQSSPRGGGGGHGHGAKPPGKPAGTNRYGLVTEFLRRVSGRADKPATPPPPPVPPAQKTKGAKNLERVPTRPPAAPPLHRNDSVTRIVNQRFMKQREDGGRGQREDGGRGQREERGGGLSQNSRSSLSSSAAEDGNYDCSSSSTLTFCFARPSRSAQRQSSALGRLQRHRQPPAVSTPAAAAMAAADSHCG